MNEISRTGLDIVVALNLLKDHTDEKSFRGILRLYEVLSRYNPSLAAPDQTLFSPDDTRFIWLPSNFSSNDTPVPVLFRELAQTDIKQDDFMELFNLLSRPHLKNLLYVYETVVQKRYEPCLPEIPNEVDEDEGADIKVIRLNKNQEPLGATIKLDEQTGHLVIARIMHGGVADRSGCFNVGDRVIEVNGMDVNGKQPSDIVRVLNTAQGNVVFKLISAVDTSVSCSKAGYSPDPSANIFIRTLFDYDPMLDRMNPCPEVGLKFYFGDILEIVNSNDPNWWQAVLFDRPMNSCRVSKIHGERHVGLIPSKELEELKAASERPSTSSGSSDRDTASSRIYKQKKIMYEGKYSTELEAALQDVNRIYEEVVHFHPDSQYKRPIVLIGPSGVGRNELKRRLILLNPDRFATTVPYTSRKQRSGETDGVEYHFVSRSTMEQWMDQNLFLEYGEYKANLYGTTLDSVRQISETLNRVCVLTPHPHAVRVLRNGDIRPFIIFVKPPSLEILKQTRQTCKVRSTFDPTYNRGFTDDELERIIEDGQKLEKRFHVYFDYVLINAFIDAAFEELLDVLICLETKPQWLPKSWVA